MHQVRSSRLRLSLLLAIGGAAWLGGCSAEAGTEAAASRPLEIGSEDLRVVGTTPTLADVQDLEVLPDDRVWVLNSLPPFFVGFREDGTLIGEHGTPGGGPEEFGVPAGFVTGGIDGEAWILDLRRHVLVRVSAPGEPRTEIPLPRASLAPGTVQGGIDLLTPLVRTARLDERVVLPHATATLESGIFTFVESLLKADLVALDPENGSVERVVSLATALDDPFDGFEATEEGFPLWRRLWAVCGGHLRVLDRVRNQLRGFDSEGSELAPVTLPAPRFSEVSAREFSEIVFPLRQAEVVGGVGERMSAEDSVRLINESTAAVRGDPRQLAAYLPTYADFRCATDGVMWLRPVDPEAGRIDGGRDWVRVTVEGTWDVVTFPERFDPYRFTPGRAWGVLRDELDVPSIAWAPVPDA